MIESLSPKALNPISDTTQMCLCICHGERVG